MIDGTTYLITHNHTYAIDAATGKMKWKHVMPLKATGTDAQRGVAYLAGKVLRGAPDGQVYARRGVKVIFHNTLASSEYGLLDQKTFEPQPNCWAALLWHQFIGPVVLDAGPSQLGLHIYAQSLPGHTGGVTLLAINNSRTQPASVDIPVEAQRNTLTAGRLEDVRI